MIQPSRVSELLEPFGLSLNSEQDAKLAIYLELLLKWNAKINLVGQATTEECVTRHFGESLFLQLCVDIDGSLLDIGSGAGFPGLALKIICPTLKVTLLEPIAKKRAFLKEVARTCQFGDVTVLGTRIEQFSGSGQTFDFATSRAVGGFDQLIENSARCLIPGGRLCLWLGEDQAASIRASSSRFNWADARPIPLSRKRVILFGALNSSLYGQCFT